MHTDHIVNAIQHHHLVSDSTLHVVAVISNPARYHSRYRLYRDFEARMLATPNVRLHTVELAFGDRHHEVTEEGNPRHLRLRSTHNLWHKENLINLGVRHLLPQDWRYVAWVDADVAFQRDRWALETIHALQHHHLVQPWSECAFQGHHGNTTELFRSFASLVYHGVPQRPGDSSAGYKYGHSGFAWACTRLFWENVGGLVDFAILGSGDHHMAWAAIGQVGQSVNGKTTDSYKAACLEWQHRALKVTRGYVGYVPGTLTHAFHGSKASRKYKERWRLLVDHGFDPRADLQRDAQGLLYVANKPHLSEGIHRYMTSRNEDSIDE